MPKGKRTGEKTRCRDDGTWASGSDWPDAALLAKEVEFVRGLAAIIGESEGRNLVCDYSYRSIQNFLELNAFGLLVCVDDSIETYLCYSGSANQAKLDFMQSSLSGALPGTWTGTKPARVIVLGEVADCAFDPSTYSCLVSPLGGQERDLGCAAVFRSLPFSSQDARAFRRVCSHIALTLEKIQLFDQVTELAIKDGLTGIFNHLHIAKKVELEIARSKRYGSSFSVILLDIDNFKDVNDGFGHQAGDHVLVEVARLLKNSVRSIDAVGRYGGEEFLAVLPETDCEAAVTMAERLRNRIQDEDFCYEGQAIKLTVSGGVAGYRDEMDSNRLIRIADENLLYAKKQGKNVVIHDRRQ